MTQIQIGTNIFFFKSVPYFNSGVDEIATIFEMTASNIIAVFNRLGNRAILWPLRKFIEYCRIVELLKVS